METVDENIFYLKLIYNEHLKAENKDPNGIISLALRNLLQNHSLKKFNSFFKDLISSNASMAFPEELYGKTKNVRVIFHHRGKLLST